MKCQSPGQMEKAVEDGDFDKMLEIKTLLGQMQD